MCKLIAARLIVVIAVAYAGFSVGPNIRADEPSVQQVQPQSNSRRADEAYFENAPPPAFYSIYFLHNLHFLAYSAMMEGRYQTAIDAARKMNGSRKVMTPPTTTDRIWSQLSDDLRRFIRRRVVDDHTTDDLLQETFLRIHRNVDKLHESDRLAAWVYQIARNAIHDYYRKSTGVVALADMDVPEENEGENQLRSSSGNWLEELVSQLPQAYQAAVRLSEIEGLP